MEQFQVMSAGGSQHSKDWEVSHAKKLRLWFLHMVEKYLAVKINGLNYYIRKHVYFKNTLSKKENDKIIHTR